MWNRLRSSVHRLAHDHEKSVLSQVLLYPFLETASWIYRAASGLLQFFYGHKWLPRRRLGFPVISVGNLTWGGAGKTPFVEYLARKVVEQHRTPLILTRGYGQDETEQIRQHLHRAVVGAGKNRWKVAQEIAAKQRIDVAILDDGLQHWPLERDVEIVMVNALHPFGNGKIVPRGILREPLPHLKRAQIIVISHANLVGGRPLEELIQRLKAVAPQTHIVTSYLEPLFFYRAKKRFRVSLDRLRKQRVTTFSGVGTPRSFQLLLAHHEIKPVRNFEFMDHHPYRREELEEIKEISKAASADEIVTTEKDYYRSASLIAETLDPLVLATRLRILSGEDILTERLFHLLGVTPHDPNPRPHQP